jgi:cytochrome c oxidase subunit II
MLRILADRGDILSPGRLIGMPENFSAHGSDVDHLIDVVQWFMIALFLGWTIFFFYCIIRFHKSNNPKADYYGVKGHLSTHLEVGVIIIEAVLLLGFALPFWSERVDTFQDAVDRNAVRVRAIGYQFGWKYHYAGEDGKFGRIDRSLVKEPGDPCIDKDDPNGFDDFVDTTLKLPVERPAIVNVTSTDVIHNYAIIPMRIQQDAIPGVDIPMWFSPLREIETSVVCAQLCGSGHANMKGRLEVVKQSDFDKWHEKMSSDVKKSNSTAVSKAPLAVK